jgi:glycosyltransferase involved in cell wall biosynthesis
MRIAIVTETYPPEINGVALTVQCFVEQLAMAGHAVELIRPRQPGAPVSLPAQNRTEVLVRGAGLPRYPGLRFGLPAPRTLRSLWTRHRPDALYIATEGPLGWSALSVARRLGIPNATGFHTRFDDFVAHYGARLLTPFVFGWLRRFHNRADATLVPTSELKTFLDESGFRHVTLLKRGVDTTLFAPERRDQGLRAEWGLGPDQLGVIHVGRIAPEKNLDLVVRTFDAIRADVPQARMIWVGDGPALPSLRQAHPEHVFCGMQRGVELARHFASGDLFLFPSLTETFGNVTIEALASGVPVVAYDYGAAGAHVRDGENGRAIAVGEAETFIASARDLARDATRRSAMRVAARRTVEGLSQASVARELAALLDGLRLKRAA